MNSRSLTRREFDIDDSAPSWLTELRRAAADALKPEDVKAIIQHQIDAAKKGDRGAIKFVMEQLLGGAALKGATFVQNIYEGREPPRDAAPRGEQVEPVQYEIPERKPQCKPGEERWRQRGNTNSVGGL